MSNQIEALPDVPWALAEKANELYLHLNRSVMPLVDDLAIIYDYLNRFASGFINKYSCCAKGCCHCCCIDVQITTVEAEYIHRAVGIPFKGNGVKLKNGNRTPCPFLCKSKQCGIYDSRPIACRYYHALGEDSEDCRLPGIKAITYGSAEGGYGNDIYRQIKMWLLHQNMGEGGVIKDIRDFFPYRDLDSSLQCE